jgi:hypothetical protein
MRTAGKSSARTAAGPNGTAASTLRTLKVKTDSGKTSEVSSHFGHGILTFQVHCLLRTEPGYNTWVTGPVNRFKDGIQPMSAMLETDWMPYTFTMNWQITRKRKWIRFEKGEPIAQFFPVPRRIVDDCEPVMQPLATDADLKEIVDGWQKARKDFIQRLEDRDPETEREGWQKHYFRGSEPRWQPRKRRASNAQSSKTIHQVLTQAALLVQCPDIGGTSIYVRGINFSWPFSERL